MRKATFTLLLVVCTGCAARPPEQAYETNGFRFVPPPGWSERARHEDAAGSPTQDRLLVQYKRLTAGHLARLRVSVADVPSSVDLARCLSDHPLDKGWRTSGRIESLEVNGLPAVRAAMAGKLQKMNYEGELLAVRQGERVYFFTAIFPMNDDQAREQARQAVTAAKWHATTEVAAR